MTGVLIDQTTSEGQLDPVPLPLVSTDRVFVTRTDLLGKQVTYKGSLDNILDWVADNLAEVDLSGYVTISSIVNSLTSTANNVPLAANQGQVLKQLIDSLTVALALKLDVSAYNEHYKGTHTSLSQLQTAHLTANAGNYALVDAGLGEDAHIYLWDMQEGWVQGGSTSLLNTDALAEGSINLYFRNDRVKAAFVREDVSFAAATLASYAIATNTVNIASRYQLLHITTSHPCRVRLYTSTAKRDADLTRPIGTDPEGNHGLMFEFISTTELLSADLSPLVDGFSDSATIPYSITNLSNEIQTISVTLNHVKTGA